MTSQHGATTGIARREIRLPGIGAFSGRVCCPFPSLVVFSALQHTVHRMPFRVHHRHCGRGKCVGQRAGETSGRCAVRGAETASHRPGTVCELKAGMGVRTTYRWEKERRYGPLSNPVSCSVCTVLKLLRYSIARCAGQACGGFMCQNLMNGFVR